MAEELDIIRRVRRRVADLKPPVRYAEEYYQDALLFALEKLSFDFGESYPAVPDVPPARVFLLVKLASIEMCFVRAAEGAEGESGEAGGTTEFTSITVPDLSVSGSASGDGDDASGPGFWMALAKALQDEYDGEVGDEKAGQVQGGEVTNHVAHRISLRHGGRANRHLDDGLPATSLTAAVDGTSVTLTWGRILRTDLKYYEIQRSSGPNFTEAEGMVIVTKVSDPVETTFIETEVPAGIWNYRLQTVNPNAIKTPSNIVVATVV